MSKKLVLLLFSALLLTLCLASSEEIDDELTPRQELFVFFIGGFSPISRMTKNLTDIIKEMLEDSDATFKESTEELQVPVTKLNHFVEEIEKLKKSKDMPLEEVLQASFQVISGMGDIVEKYDTTQMDKPSLENFKLTLQKSGFEKLSQKFSDAFTSFKPKFYVEIDKYLATLSAEERENEAKMIDWYKQFKTSPNLLNFVHFFNLYPADTIVKLEAHL